MVFIALDDRLETALFVYPIKVGWVDANDVGFFNHLTPGQAATSTIALIDAIAALTMRQTHVVVRDVAITSANSSMLTLTTHTRPDDVDSANVVIAGVSPTGRAATTAVLEPFYGISPARWLEDEAGVDESTAVVNEGTRALIPAENDDFYQEDLGRAWFLLTDKPYVSHVCVASRALLAREPAMVAAAVDRLASAAEVGRARGRELRRDLSKDLGIDRETLTDTLADQTLMLDDAGIDGLAELARRMGLGISKKELLAAVVSVSR